MIVPDYMRTMAVGSLKRLSLARFGLLKIYPDPGKFGNSMGISRSNSESRLILGTC